MRIRADQALHCLDGLFRTAELVVRPRHLIEDLVAVLVTGVFGKQPIVDSDRLEWTIGICAITHRDRWRGAGAITRQNSGLRCRSPLEILIGFVQTSCSVRIGTAGSWAREYLGGLRGGQFPRLGVARTYPELLLDLQVREAPHGFRSHCSLRCLLEESAVLLHGLIEALLDLHLLHVGTHVPQLRQRPHRPHWLDGTGGAADHENRRDHYWNSEARHQCPPASD